MTLEDHAYGLYEKEKECCSKKQTKPLLDNNYPIEIYLDDGRVFSYNVVSAEKVREHASAIIQNGYRHSSSSDNSWEWYPAHRILKVKSYEIPSLYHDTVRGT